MTDHSARTFTGDFKRFFLRGLVVLLPSVLTLWIVVKAYQFVDGSVAQPINRGLRLALTNATPFSDGLRKMFDPNQETVARDLHARLAELDESLPGRIPDVATLRLVLDTPAPGPLADLPEPERTAAMFTRSSPALRDRLLRAREGAVVSLRAASIRQWWEDHWYTELIGVVVAIIAVYSAGRLLGGYLGRSLYKRIERLITSIPVFKQVYPSVKQVVDFLFGDEQPIKFNRVVAVEYPRKGIWSVGFLTGESLKAIETTASDELVTVFIPSSPTPFTGYTITIPRRDILDLALTVDEALRFAVSAGVLVPDHLRARPPAGSAAAVAASTGGEGLPESSKAAGSPAVPEADEAHGGRAGPSAAR